MPLAAASTALVAGKLKVGSSAVDKAYLGATQVWPPAASGPSGGSNPTSHNGTINGGVGDMYSSGPTAFYISDVSNAALIGDFSASGFDSAMGLLFRSVALPRGTTLTSATVSITAHQLVGTILGTTIRAVNAANVTAPPTSQTQHAALTLTTASVAWTPSTWVGGTRYTTPDLSAVLNEVLQRSDWVSGNNLMVVIGDSVAGWPGAARYITVRGYSFAANNSNAPTLAASGTY
jgi:hypothetical protein